MRRFFRPRGKELYVSSIRYSQLKNFSKGELFFKEGTFFHKMDFFSRGASSPAPHESWELVPLDELSLLGIFQLWNQRFQVSGMRRRGNLCGFPVIASSDSGAAILAGISSLRGAIAPWQSYLRKKDCFYTSSITPLR